MGKKESMKEAIEYNTQEGFTSHVNPDFLAFGEATPHIQRTKPFERLLKEKKSQTDTNTNSVEDGEIEQEGKSPAHTYIKQPEREMEPRMCIYTDGS
jgi:hypothetical protein